MENALAYVLIAGTFVFMAIGAPLFLCFGLAMLVLANSILGISFTTVASKLWSNIDSFAFLALPLYMLAGNIMTEGKLSGALVDFMNSLIRHVRGGLGVAVVVCCAIFAAMCGSVIATAAAIGMIMSGYMVEAGYRKELSAAIIASSAVLGPIIPPSIWLIVYGVITETNIAALFLGGFLPGILLAIALGITAYIIAQKEKVKVMPPATWPERGTSFVKAIPALLAPIFILGGIYGGIVTPTEAGVVACVYALIAGMVFYKGMTWGKILPLMKGAITVVANISLLVTTAVLMGYALVQLGISDAILGWIQSAGLGVPAFMVFYCVLLFVLGMFLEAICIMVLVVPVLFPVAMGLGINPVHFGLILALGLGTGQISPPFGITLFTVAAFTNQPSGGVFKAALPFLFAMTIVLFLVAFFPQITLFLVELWM